MGVTALSSFRAMAQTRRCNFGQYTMVIAAMAVIGSMHEKSVTKVAVKFVATGLRDAGCTVDVLDLAKEQLPLVNTDITFKADYFFYT